MSNFQCNYDIVRGFPAIDSHTTHTTSNSAWYGSLYTQCATINLLEAANGSFQNLGVGNLTVTGTCNFGENCQAGNIVIVDDNGKGLLSVKESEFNEGTIFTIEVPSGDKKDDVFVWDGNDWVVKSVPFITELELINLGTPMVGQSIFGTPIRTGGNITIPLRKLFSGDGTITITEDVSGAVDLRATGGGAGDATWESLLDATATDVMRYRTANPTVTSTESILFGVQNFNTTGSQAFWHSPTSSFRSGTADTTEWNITNLGDNSFASGLNTIASGTQSFAMGSSVEIDSLNTAGFGADHIINGISSTNSMVGGSGNTSSNIQTSIIFGGDMSGEMINSVIFGGSGASAVLVGADANTGVVSGPITGSFGAFDNSQDAKHTFSEDYQSKQMFQNGFIRGGGSRANDGSISATLGNDGARERMLPFRLEISANTTKEIMIPLNTNHIVTLRGNILLVGATFSERGSFNIDGGVFTSDSGTVTMDKPPTVSLLYGDPGTDFNIDNIDFSVVAPNIVIEINAPTTTTIIMNAVFYLYDLTD